MTHFLNLYLDQFSSYHHPVLLSNHVGQVDLIMLLRWVFAVPWNLYPTMKLKCVVTTLEKPTSSVVNLHVC